MSKKNDEGFIAPKTSFEGFSTRELSDQLNALGLEDDEDSNDAMNVSDFLNSCGELTGLSEWSDEDGDEEFDFLQTQKKQGQDDGNVESDASSASTESIEVSMLKSKKIHPEDTTCCEKQNHFQANGNEDEVDMSSSTAAKPEKVHTVPNYGCRVFSGFGLDILKPSDSSGWRVLPGAETEQIFIRAPNFRTPGGYKPPLFEKEPRNLTNEELLEEVKEMYSDTGLDEKEDSDTQNESLEFLILNTDEEKSEKGIECLEKEFAGAVEVEEAIVVKSKSWLCNEKSEPLTQDALAQIFTESYRGDISRCLPRNRLSPSSRKENLEELSRIWNDIQETKQRLENDMSLIVTPSSMDKIKSTKSDLNPKFNKIIPTSPASLNSRLNLPTQSVIPKRSVSFGKRAFIPDTFVVRTEDSKIITVSDGEPNQVPQALPKARPKRWVRRSKGKQRSRESQGSALVANSSGTPNSMEPKARLPFLEPGFGFDQSEIEQILNGTDMQESDFDEILSEISDDLPSNVGINGTNVDLFNDPNSPYELSSALQQLQISDWAKEGAQEFMQKYYEERYRRDHCETEISKLQKELLEMKEKVAVSDGILRGKELTIAKFSKLWEGLLTQWKSHEKGCKTHTAQLKSENELLKKEIEESRKRITAYEDELEKALEVSGNFRQKIQTTMDDLETERAVGKEEKKELEVRLNSIEIVLEGTKAEKDSGLRALRDCQDSLDSTKELLTNTSDELARMKSIHSSQDTKMNQLETAIEKLKTQVIETTAEKSELSSNAIQLAAEVAKLKGDKVILESMHESELRQKLKEDREKLHDYYNTKIKEILQTESEKMMEAEREFIHLHDQKLVTVEEEAEKRLEEMRLKFANQVHHVKSKFESQLTTLKKENDEQGRLIDTVSQQLRNFNELSQHGERRTEINGSNNRGGQEPIGLNSGDNSPNSILSLVEAISNRKGRLNSLLASNNGNNQS